MNDQEFRVLLDLCMVSDPWPLGEDERETFDRMLKRESERRGFDSWVVAYHEYDPTPPETPDGHAFRGWDGEREFIEVTFPNGVTYQFLEVPAEVQGEWRNSDSPGEYYLNNIRGEYRYIRVSG